MEGIGGCILVVYCIKNGDLFGFCENRRFLNYFELPSAEPKQFYQVPFSRFFAFSCHECNSSAFQTAGRGKLQRKVIFQLISCPFLLFQVALSASEIEILEMYITT